MSTATNLLGETTSRCEFSKDRRHRFVLERRWAGDGPGCMFVGLNPSTADEESNDPTIRRCIGFAQTLGYPALVMTNLYSFRSTDPGMLGEDANDPANDQWLLAEALTAGIVIAAWGATSAPRKRARVRELEQLLRAQGVELFALARTRDGSPRHPLYLHSNCRPSRWMP